MNDITDFRNFIATLIRPIINEAVKESLEKYHLDKYSKHTELPDLLNITQTAELLGLSPATLYTKVHNRTIPYIKTKGSKTLRFSRKKIMEWLDDGQKETQSSMEQRANDYLVSKK